MLDRFHRLRPRRLQKELRMNTLAATFSQLRAPSAKTIVVSLLQTFAFGAILYAAALICASISEVVADQGEVAQMLYRWAWIAPAPFHAMAIGIKLTADALGDTSKRSPLLVNPTNAADGSLARQGQHRLKTGCPLSVCESFPARLLHGGLQRPDRPSMRFGYPPQDS